MLVSFGFVIILFFFSHWRSYKIIVQNTQERSPLLVQERSKVESDRKESKCRSESGLQMSAHCVNKGNDEKYCGFIIV